LRGGDQGEGEKQKRSHLAETAAVAALPEIATLPLVARNDGAFFWNLEFGFWILILKTETQKKELSQVFDTLKTAKSEINLKRRAIGMKVAPFGMHPTGFYAMGCPVVLCRELLL